MKLFGKITDPADVTNKKYVDDIADKVFYATKDVTTAQELIAAFNAGKIIVLRQMQIDNTYPFVVAQFAAHNASHCSLVAYNVNGMTLSNGIMVMKYSVVNGAWTLNMQSLQNKLESGINLKTVNNQSLLGEGNINIEGGGGDDSARITVESWDQYQKATVKIVNSLEPLVGSAIKITVQEGRKEADFEIYNYAQDFQEWFSLPTTELFNETTQNLQTQLGTLTDLTTDDKTNLVNAINEVYEKSGEPFRVKNWATNSLNVTIPTCTSDISNTQIPKMVYSINEVEGADYQIVGMIAYEVFDAASGGNRINCWPVCQFTGNGQKELSVRWMCGGTTDKVAKRINAWVLLKHR